MDIIKAAWNAITNDPFLFILIFGLLFFTVEWIGYTMTQKAKEKKRKAEDQNSDSDNSTKINS